MRRPNAKPQELGTDAPGGLVEGLAKTLCRGRDARMSKAHIRAHLSRMMALTESNDKKPQQGA